MLYFRDNLKKETERKNWKLLTLTDCLSLPDDNNDIHP